MKFSLEYIEIETIFLVPKAAVCFSLVNKRKCHFTKKKKEGDAVLMKEKGS